MMKYRMIVMGFFFYKMAAGMCVYFTVSTLWGLTERKLLKRKMPNAKLTPEPAPALVADPGPPPSANGSGGLVGRFRRRLMDKMEEMQQQADTSRQIVNPPKPGQPPQPGPNGKGPGGKKKRKKK